MIQNRRSTVITIAGCLEILLAFYQPIGAAYGGGRIDLLALLAPWEGAVLLALWIGMFIGGFAMLIRIPAARWIALATPVLGSAWAAYTIAFETIKPDVAPDTRILGGVFFVLIHAVVIVLLTTPHARHYFARPGPRTAS